MDRIRLVAVLVLCGVTLISSSQGHQPQLGPQGQRGVKSGTQYVNKHGRLSSRSFAQNARRFVQEHPGLVEGALNDLQATFKVNRQPGSSVLECPGSGPWVCPTSTGAWTSRGVFRRSSKAERGTEKTSDNKALIQSVTKGWHRLMETVTVSESDDCEPCISLMTTFQTYACDNGLEGWDTIRDVIIGACELSFFRGDLDPVMCNGTVTLQGEHVYCIVLEVEPRAFCESLSYCYPEDTRSERPPINQRTPWAVKASEEGSTADQTPEQPQRDYREPAQVKTTRDGLVMVAQLTDIHLQQNHVTGAPSECEAYVCCLDSTKPIGTHTARQYGEYNCNLPPKTLDLFLDRVDEANPDFLIYAGDSPPHTIWDETLQSQVNCSQLVANAMNRAFPSDKPVYVNIGNHEMFPTNIFSMRLDDTKTMLEDFTRMWHERGRFDATANDTMSSMGYYTVTVPDHPGLRIMSINTNYDWYNGNFYNVLNQATEENARHQQWITDTLSAARDNNQKVIVIAHHPVGGSDSHIRSARWWEEVTKEYGDVIALHVSGHTHSNEFKLSFDHDTMRATSINHVMASTTTNTDVNPTLRVFYLDPDNDYAVVDYENFYLDVKTQNDSIGVPPVVAFSHSARDLYGMADLTPDSWKKLVYRFIDDDALFQTYYKNIKSEARDTFCDTDCKSREICSLWFAEISEVDDCVPLANIIPTNAPPVETPTVGGTMPTHNGAVWWSLILTVSLVLSNI